MTPAQETARQWESQVIELAHLCGWLVHHQRPARKADGGWVSAIAGDKGFPDLVLAKKGRMLLAELKTGKARLSADQKVWRDALTGESGICYFHVWRPEDWDEIVKALRRDS